MTRNTKREISLRVSADEMLRRASENPATPPDADRGFLKLFLDTVTQADQGVDFDFLRAPVIVGKVPER